ncbi:MAG: GntR family transcriptional regulator [Hyphomicrobiales bacterium]|nr:GntR family transcriptional regulator [Hyphomicrobiales bacterium]
MQSLKNNSRTVDPSVDIDHQPISVRIRNALMERIIAGHYAPGDRLVELQLAREFGSSQAPVREALRDLENAGLVTIRPRRGSFVNDYHATTQHEIYVVRGALEEAAMRLAIDRLCAEPDIVGQHLDGMRQAATDGDLEGIIHHSVWFHRVIMQAAGNALLLRTWESLHVELQSRKTLLQPNIDMSAVAESHAPILDAIVAGDTELACRLSREHQAYFELKA